MKVGDLVKRKKPLDPHLRDKRENGEFGIVMKLAAGGIPVKPTVVILYPPSGREYEIARSLLEVISESR